MVKAWLTSRVAAVRRTAARVRHRLTDAPAKPALPSHLAIFKVAEFEALRTELGFQTASAAMQELADRLVDALPGGEIWRVGRTTLEMALDGDSGDDLVQRLTRARAHLQQPILIDGLEVTFDILCGAAAIDPLRTISEAVDRASGALVQAQAVRSSVAISNGDDRRAETIGDFELSRALKAALDAHELRLFYQPKLHCRDDRVHSVEALLRWTHAELGAMPIERVIAAAERTGIIRALTDWVVRRAIAGCGDAGGAGP